jgi:threonylcarbamoyladenosine tRNA methylthiotransferase MtaB
LRGRSRSLRPEEVVEQVNGLVAAGYREVVISGINLGRWGRDLPRPTGSAPSYPSRLEDLVRAILDKTPLQKLRISSVEPMDWSNSLIRLMAESFQNRQARARAHAVGKRRGFAANASQIPSVALPGED